MRNVLFAAAIAALTNLPSGPFVCAEWAAAPAEVTQPDTIQKPDAKAAQAEAPTVTPQMLQPLEAVAKQLAKGGRERETQDLLSALDKLGYPKASHDKLAASCKDDLEKAKDLIDSLPSGAKSLRAVAKQLAGVMQQLSGDEQLALARNILLLDGECVEAHTVLGSTKVGSNWISPDQVAIRERRGEIVWQVQAARELEVQIETGTVDDPLVQQACGVQATFATYGILEVRTNFNVEKTERILREALRASALSSFIRTGTLKLPPNPQHVSQRRLFVFLDSREKTIALGKALLASGGLEDGSAELMKKTDQEVTGFGVKRTEEQPGAAVSYSARESDAEVTLLESIVNMRDGKPTPLTVGHLNWLALVCFGDTLPNYVDRKKGSGPGDTRVETEAEKREREEWLRVARAGIKGSRRWMQFLAEKSRDPAFALSFVDTKAQITGENLHKCTSIVEFLQEAGLFADTYTKLLPANSEKTMARYAAALGMSVGDLEAKWRAWILGGQPGVAERIDKARPELWPADALKILAYLNELREKALKPEKKETGWKLQFDSDLSEACALHAAYLAENPDQKNEEAGEEFPGKPGFTPEGAWAGSQSAILFGPQTDQFAAIDKLMGSFYGRLALIHPGLLRIGWGSNDHAGVLDANSLLAPSDKPYLVVWPYKDQSGVPLAYSENSYPNPSGAEDAPPLVPKDTLGYPITLLTRPTDDKGLLNVIEMKLLDGKDVVECWFSSPQKPSNPEHAPEGAWCLIPKSPLKPGTLYKVIAEWKIGRAMDGKTNAGQYHEWTFRTG